VILLIDNYDSFVYNLARYLCELGCSTRVVRNDALSVDQIERMAPQAVVISPGPCAPAQAGISVELVRKLSPSIPLLGVCLGHQAIGEALGAHIARAPAPVHGFSCPVHHDSSRLFAGLPNPLHAGRYHSLCIIEETLPSELRVTARAEDGVVMAIEHVSRPTFGVQFHPESVLTECGHRLLANFLSAVGLHTASIPGGDLPAEAGTSYDPRLVAGIPIHW
jgi:anthranilate synthase/aminodeoxychorismate synthase-like glutamine amidotransferase